MIYIDIQYINYICILIHLKFQKKLLKIKFILIDKNILIDLKCSVKDYFGLL